jgi:RNA polymerase sigma-70 factor, ECF subfamily
MVMTATPDDPDRALARQYLDGSEAAFRQLYRRHTPRMRGIVLRLLGRNAHEVDDVVQESWLRACAALDRFRWDSSLSTWLCGIGTHAALEVLRRNARWAGDAALEFAAANTPTPGDGLDVATALDALPPRQRAVMVLHDLEGYTHDEIAALMGIVPGTSKSQLTHARNAMRSALRSGG